MPVTIVSSWRTVRDRLRAILAALCLLLAAYYACTTIASVWQLGFTEMFADQFRQYARLLELPFPDNVLAPDNAHRQIASNMVRLADLHWGAGNQRIGVMSGLLMLVVAWVMLVVCIWRDTLRGTLFRAAAVLLATVALMWMGAARMQFHGNESFQVYLVMICAVLVIFCVERLRDAPALKPVAWAIAAALLALLTFGTGVAVFGLLVAMMVVRGVALRWLLPTALIGAAAVLSYLFLLPGADGVRGSLTLAPLEVARNASCWLASFWTSSWLSFAHEGGAGITPEQMATLPSGAAIVVSARWMFALTGQPSLLNMACGLGAAGMLVWGGLILHAWRHPRSVSSIHALGLGLSTFALMIAVLVALGRATLFAQHPDQILAERYVQWTNVFWLGLALAFACWCARGQGPAPDVGMRIGGFGIAIAAIAVAGLVYPTHWLWHGWAASAEREIEKRAAQLQTGVLTPGIETHTDTPDLQHLQSALDVLRLHAAGMFRSPRSRLMGTTLPRLPVLAGDPLVHLGAVTAVAAYGESGHRGWQVDGDLLDPGLRHIIDGLIAVDGTGRVVGMGEFGYSYRRWRWTPVDFSAEGFDLYARSLAPCTVITVYGVDDAATRFVGLVAIRPEPCSG